MRPGEYIYIIELGHHWSGNGLSTFGGQAITRINDDLYRNFSEILVEEIWRCRQKKMANISSRALCVDKNKTKQMRIFYGIYMFNCDNLYHTSITVIGKRSYTDHTKNTPCLALWGRSVGYFICVSENCPSFYGPLGALASIFTLLELRGTTITVNFILV